MKFNPLSDIRPNSTSGTETRTGPNPVLTELFQTDLKGVSPTGGSAPVQNGQGLLTGGIVPTQNRPTPTIGEAFSRFDPHSSQECLASYAFINNGGPVA